jgi:lipoprotein-anchoring transpeptidase ErfK/SrfK
MIERQPEAARWANGMPGGPENPLGARALYLFADGRDTLYRIHGTAEPWSIGRAVSSGCVRLLNADVIDLYRRVPLGARVVVRPSAGMPPLA